MRLDLGERIHFRDSLREGLLDRFWDSPMRNFWYSYRRSLYTSVHLNLSHDLYVTLRARRET